LREIPFAAGLRKVKIWYAGRKKIREEIILSNLCDVITAVSEVDARYYSKIANNHNKVFLFSNVIDLNKPNGFNYR
jgi:hypothetical protein